MAGRFASFKINNETQTGTASHRQILLCDLQVLAPCAKHGAELFWVTDIHVTVREYYIELPVLQAIFYRSVK
jgi:hypothetical protein